MLNFLLQDPTTDAVDGLEPIVEEKTISLMELLLNGGVAGQIIIAVLFVLLFVAMYIYFERLFAIKSASKIDSNFMNQIRDNVGSGNLEAAKLLCVSAKSGAEPEMKRRICWLASRVNRSSFSNLV